MDEAFSALDPSTGAEMRLLIRRVWAEFGMTVFFVTHNINEAVTLGTRVIVLAKAQVTIRRVENRVGFADSKRYRSILESAEQRGAPAHCSEGGACHAYALPRFRIDEL